ncbi:MAG: hypothetical protein L3J10_06475 [Sulfurimonas sp.]|nr:hypothetical protein [Sulfurimonas sp.]
MNIKYSEKSVKDLKSFTQPDRTLIVKKLHYFADNFEILKEPKKVRELKGSEFKSQYKFTVAKKIRVLFRVGSRKDIY